MTLLRGIRIAAGVIPAAFVLSAVLYYPALTLGEWLGLWGDPPKTDRWAR